MKRVFLIACCCLAACLVSTQAMAANMVLVESRNFPADTLPACTVGVFLTNDISVTGISLPLELRSVNGGAYPQGSAGNFSTLTTTFFTLNPNGRVNKSPLGAAYDNLNDSIWPAANITSSRFDTVATVNDCSGPESHSWAGSIAAPTPDGLDATFWASVSTGIPADGALIALAAGTDPAPPNRALASWRFIFNTNALEGCFVIDTCCRQPASHLLFVDSMTTSGTPSEFTKGEITIGAGTCGAPPACELSITCPPNATVECGASTDPANTGNPTVTDNGQCGTVTTTFSDVSAGTCPTIITRTWTASGTLGGNVQCVQTITVNDTQDPSITCPGPATVQCLADIPAANNALVTASDVCDQSLTITNVTGPLVGNGCGGTVTRTYTATDDCGNSASCTQVFTVNDTQNPTITCPGPISVECLTAVPAPNNALVTTSDNCDVSLTITSSDGPLVGGACGGTITRTYTATDDCGNFASCTQIITVDDNTNPTITCPGPISVDCLADVPVPNNALVTAADNCDLSLTITSSDGPLVGGACGGTITRTYTATDDCGNFASCTQTITVNDQTPPVLGACPNDTTIIVPNGTLNVVVNYSFVPTATDNCTVPQPVVANPPTGSTFTTGTTTPVNVTATDGCGNIDACSFNVTVVEQAGNIPPNAICQNVSVNADADCLVDVTPGQVDNGSNDPDGTIANMVLRPAGPYGNGAQVYLVVTDNEGALDSCLATITVVDVTDPTIACPGPISVECAADVPAPNNGLVTASDNCDASLTITSSDGPLVGGACGGTITRTYTATDDAGNFASCTQVITVDDTQNPTITCPGPITVACLADVPAPNNALVTALDNCDLNLAITNSDGLLVGGQCGGTITRTYTATDDCGNSASCTQIITVDDNTPPVVTCPNDTTVLVAAGTPNVIVVYSLASATDNCAGAPSITYNPVSGFQFAVPSVTPVTVTATDDCGNQSTCQFTVTIQELAQDEPPTAICQDVTVDAGPSCTADASINNGSFDPDGGAVTLRQEPPGPYSLGTTPVTLWVVDNEADSTSCTGNVTVEDNTSPVIACPQVDIQANNDQGQCGAVVAFDLDVTDNCPGGITEVYTPTSGSFFPVGVTPVQLVATDAAGNQAVCNFNVVVNDVEDPAITCPFDVIVDAEPGQIGAFVTFGISTATDNCGIASHDCDSASGSFFLIGTTQVCCQATDLSGNNASCCFSVTVNPPGVEPGPRVDSTVVSVTLPEGSDCDTVPVNVTWEGAGGTDFDVVEVIPWLVAEPTHGTAPTSVDLIICATGLAPGPYDGIVYFVPSAVAKGVTVPTDSVIVHLLVEPVVCTPFLDAGTDGVYDDIDTLHFYYASGVLSDDCLSLSVIDVNACNSACWTVIPGYDSHISSVTPSTGNVPSLVEVCVDPCGLDEGDYNYPLLFCLCPGDKGEPGACDFVIVAIHVSNPPTLIVNPTQVDFGTLTHGDAAPPQAVSITNGGGGTIDWNATSDAAWFDFAPSSGSTPSSIAISIDWTGIPMPSTCVDLIDTIHVSATEESCALFAEQLIEVLLRVCPPAGGTTLCCDLCEGWNTWSYNLALPDYSREVVLASIAGKYDEVRSMRNCDIGPIKWEPGDAIGPNSLTTVEPWFGYSIHMTEAATVCITGQPIDPTTPIYLCDGWNFVSYLPTQPDNIQHALQSLAGNYTHVYTTICGYGTASFNTSRNARNNDLFCMEPCQGYWIKLRRDDTLVYPAAVQGCNGAAKQAVGENGRVKPSPLMADYHASSSALSTGDLLSVLSSSGQLVGECTVGENGAFLVHVYGDVPMTPDIEGAVEGDELSFEVNGMAASSETSVVWTSYDDRDISVTVSSASPVPTEYALLQNYPNPFNAGTVMPFVLRDASQWTLTVYNVMGQEVRTFSGFDAGTVRVSWDGTDRDGAQVASGIYFYRVNAANWSGMKKMTLLK